MTEKNVTVELDSEPVCCLSDIPIAHLAYHASRYGRFAVGFHREAVLQHGFNPVFYTLEASTQMHSIYQALTQLGCVDSNEIHGAISEIEEGIDDAQMELGEQIEGSSSLEEILWEADSMARTAQDAYKAFQKFMALVKTFRADEFDTIYCEREWRSLENFAFEDRAIAMIVLPTSVNRRNYFEPFRSNVFDKLGLPETLPVIPWEDLIEH